MRSRPLCQWSIAGEALIAFAARAMSFWAFIATHATRWRLRRCRSLDSGHGPRTVVGCEAGAQAQEAAPPPSGRRAGDPVDGRSARRSRAGERRTEVLRRTADPGDGRARTEAAPVGRRHPRRTGRSGRETGRPGALPPVLRPGGRAPGRGSRLVARARRPGRLAGPGVQIGPRPRPVPLTR